MSEPCYFCSGLSRPICQPIYDKMSIRVKITFAGHHYMKLEKEAQNLSKSVGKLIRDYALQKKELLESKKKESLLPSFTNSKQVRIYFSPTQYQKLEREAKQLNIPIQQLIRISTLRA